MKKFLKWFVIIIVLLLVVLVSIPFLFKGKIVALVKEETNKSLNAKVDFTDINLSLIRNFPNLSVKMENLSVVNVTPFSGDTLIFAKDMQVAVDLMSVIKGDQIRIRKVFLDEAVMNFLVNDKGQANWDIAKPSTEPTKPSEPSSFKANLNYYAIKNSRILYDDKTLGFRIELNPVDHHGSGDFTQDLFVLSTHTESERTTLNYGGVDYLNKVNTKIDADLEMDMKNFRFTFKDNKIALNDLRLEFSGWLAMPDTNMDMDLKFAAKENDFKNFISLVPAVYTEEFKNAKASGKMSFDGWAKGRYNGKSMPGFGLKLDIDNGALKYPSLPSELKNVFVKLNIQNPDGDLDHTAVDLSRMHMELGSDPFDAKLILKTPISDPDFDASMKGKIDFAGIGKIVPLEKGTSLSGILTADFSAKGRYSYVTRQQYDQFTANGNIGITGMNYSSPSLKQPVQISQLAMSFNPRNVVLSAFSMKAGNTDLQATGTLENFIPYALKGETIKGNMRLTSNKIDLNEWMSEDTKAATSGDTTAITAPEIPGNIDFTLTAAIRQLLYTNLIMSNCSGEITVRNKTISMNNLKLYMIDGSVLVNGSYNAINPKSPEIAFDFNINDFDLQKTASSFATVQKIAPIIQSCMGKYSCSLKMNAAMDGKMNLVMNTLTGGGLLNTSSIVVSGSNALVKVGDALKMDRLKKLTIPKASISFMITEGRLHIQPFDAELAGMKTTISGSNGFDQTLDYVMKMQIPRSSFGSAANSVMEDFLNKAEDKGVKLNVGDAIPVGITITGTVTNPKIGTDISAAGAKVTADLKAAAAAAFDKKKAEAEAKAKEEIAKAKADAEARMKAETDKVKKEADARAKAAADSAKKAASKRAEDELKKLNPFKKK